VAGNWLEEFEARRTAADGATLQDGFLSAFSGVGLSEKPAL